MIMFAVFNETLVIMSIEHEVVYSVCNMVLSLSVNHDLFVRNTLNVVSSLLVDLL